MIQCRRSSCDTKEGFGNVKDSISSASSLCHKFHYSRQTAELLSFPLNKQLCTPLGHQPNKSVKLVIIHWFLSIVVVNFPPFTLSVVADLCNYCLKSGGILCPTRWVLVIVVTTGQIWGWWSDLWERPLARRVSNNHDNFCGAVFKSTSVCSQLSSSASLIGNRHVHYWFPVLLSNPVNWFMRLSFFYLT